MLRLSRFALFIGAASVLAAAGRPAGPAPTVTQAKAALAQLPLRFEANQGQLGPRVRYSAHAGGYDLFPTEHGPSLSFHTAARHSRQVDISLENSNRAPEIEAL